MKLPTIYLLLFIIIYSNCSQCSDFIFGENFEGDKYLTCNNLATSDSLFNCYINDDYSGCVEKECKDMNPYNCQEFIPKDNLKKCIVNPQSEECQLFTCSELNQNFCYEFGHVDDKFCVRTEKGCELKTCEESSENCGAFYPKGNKYCVFKNVVNSNSGCEYKSCEELSSGNCNKVIFSIFGNFDYDAVCTDNNDGHCVTKNCSLLTENCENLILEHAGYKCISDGNGKCFPTKKNCEEIDRFQCGAYMGNEEDSTLRRLCINNIDNTSCILTTCEALSSSECNKYNFGGTYDEEKCIVDGEKCKLIKCEELTKDKCDVFGYYMGYKKCVPSESNCKLVGCKDMPPDQCESFIMDNPLYKCTKKANYCTEFVKDCEELPVDLCSSFFNYYDDKICVQSEDNKRCELKDRNWNIKEDENEKEKYNQNKSNIIKFSFYFIGLLSLF